MNLSTWYCYVYLHKSEDKTIEVFKHNKLENENQLSKKIKIIKSDRDDEYNFIF